MPFWKSRLLLIGVLWVATIGCTFNSTPTRLPSKQQLVRDQLLIHSDFELPKHHRLLDELTARRHDISESLGIPVSDEPINVYLFEDQDKFREFMTRTHPDFPSRRAFFVKNDTSLNVYAFWGSRVGEDLRHEVTHGYLHSVVPNLPLWLDEGIAEYFEVGRGKGGLNGPHIYHLSTAFQRGDWRPNLSRLEAIDSPNLLTQLDYAESWLWVHFLLTGDTDSKAIIRDQLQQLRISGKSKPMLPMVATQIPDYETQLIMHLKVLASDRKVTPKP